MSEFQLDEFSRNQRREAISKHPTHIGLDYVEVLTDPPRLLLFFVPKTSVESDKLAIPQNLTRANIRLTKGMGVTDANLQVQEIIKGDSRLNKKTENGSFNSYDNNILGKNDILTLNLLEVKDSKQTLSETNNSSVYTLELVNVQNLDPFFSKATFSLKINEPSQFDPSPLPQSLPEPSPVLEINYLARDYSSFRQLMLDRLSVIMPQWKERNPADLGVALVEVLAYTADRLSYYQDAVATEAYLGTARRRISVRRHARLIDYAMHEGCNARVWVQVQVKDVKELPSINQLSISLSDDNQGVAQQPQIFKPIYPIDRLFQEHNEINFYTWGAREFYLAEGTTQATLKGSFQELKTGNVLIFEEVLSPKTRNSEDADLNHRHAVRLTKVDNSKEDLLGIKIGSGTISTKDKTVTGSETKFHTELKKDDIITVSGQLRIVTAITSDTELTINTPFSTDLPLKTSFNFYGPQALTEIEWHAQDALPFPLYISVANADKDISVARGNIVLAEHGRSIVEELPPVPENGRYRPRLQYVGLTHAVPYDKEKAQGQSAKEALEQDPRAAVPMINLREIVSCQGTISSTGTTVTGDDQTVFTVFTKELKVGDAIAALNQRRIIEVIASDGSLTIDYAFCPDLPVGTTFVRETETWWAKRDLLNSDRLARDFVVEMESDGYAYLRFGDGEHGFRPTSNTRLQADYRIGNGVGGNVGQDAIKCIVCDQEIGKIEKVCNPLPAQGGTDAEPIEQVRLYAPQVFRSQQERCVTTEDYQKVAETHPEVEKAAAILRWTGSWYTVFISVKRRGNRLVDQAFKETLLNFIEPYRLAGYDLEILAPRFVPLDIALTVKVGAGHFADTVKRTLLETFSNVDLPNGQRGFFHPDNFSFGQSVYLSQVMKRVMGVPGIVGVYVTQETDVTIRFQRWGSPEREELKNGQIPIASLEIARLDNDRNAPQNGRIEFYLQGGL